MPAEYFGKTREQMNKLLETMCDIEDRTEFSDEEQEAIDIAIQCVATVINQM